MCLTTSFVPSPSVSFVTVCKSSFTNPGLSLYIGNGFSEQDDSVKRTAYYRIFLDTSCIGKNCKPPDSCRVSALTFQSGYNCQGDFEKPHNPSISHSPELDFSHHIKVFLWLWYFPFLNYVSARYVALNTFSPVISSSHFISRIYKSATAKKIFRLVSTAVVSIRGKHFFKFCTWTEDYLVLRGQVDVF